MIRSLKTTLNPAWYHGHGEQPPFFEGWYYKLVDQHQEQKYAIIPGIYLSDDPGEHHAFIQVLDGTTGQSTYHRYAATDFWAARDRFDLRIGPNRFTADYISVDIDTPDLVIKGELHFHDISPWPVTVASPGIMGWYAWVPFMECYHGIVSLDHGIAGALGVNGKRTDFSGGRGYTEKDWGQSFPAAYVWHQTNHFAVPGTSLTASVAIIPWVRRSFPGFIVGLWHQGALFRFATYTGASIEALEVTEAQVIWAVRTRQYRLEMVATRTEGSLLQAPTTTAMNRRIGETLNATVDVTLSELARGKARTLFSGLGHHAGLEVIGALDQLQALWASGRKSS
jgi:hypothetical protein